MVYSMIEDTEASASDALDRIFAALAHDTRRRLVRYLAARHEAPRMWQVARDNGLSPQLLNKHTAALEKAGLVRRVLAGRESTLVVDRSALIEAQGWILATQAFWQTQFDALDTYLGEIAAGGSLPAPPDREL